MQEGHSSRTASGPTPLRLSLSPTQENTTRTEAPPPPAAVGAPTVSTTQTAATQPLSPPRVPPARFVAGRRRRNDFNPVVTVHGTDWFKNDAATKLPVNGPIMDRDFAIKTPIGDTITRSSDKNSIRSRLDYFMLIFPPAELTLITQLTSQALVKDCKKPTTKGEIMKFFGACILITRFEFSRRASLWCPQLRPPSIFQHLVWVRLGCQETVLMRL
jgi:hypothetical protein